MSLALPEFAGALAKRLARAPAPSTGAGMLQRRAERRAEEWDRQCDLWLAQRTRVDLRYRWREAALRLGLGTNVMTALGGTGPAKVPIVEHCDQGDPVAGVNAYLIVRMPPGLIVADLEDVARELAESLGVWRLRFTPRAAPFVRVDLIDVDPLEGGVPFLPVAPPDHLVVGVHELGETVSMPLESLTHCVAQGPTRSGKSAFTYSILAQLALRSDVVVAGIDPTGLVLEPWGPHPWRAIDAGDDPAARYLAVVEGLVDEMERRIRALRSLRPRTDTIPAPSVEWPLIVVVLEEWPAVGRILGHKRDKPSAVHKGIARLLSESGKAGMRVWILAQRSDADSVGAGERDQCLTRITFRGADGGTIRMLHEVEIPDDVLEAQAASPQGVALLTAPGLPLVRFRGPWLGSYAAYCDAVSVSLPVEADQAV